MLNQNSFDWYNTIANDDLDDFKIDFAVAVERALEHTDKRRVELAADLGVTPSRITKVLSGESNLTMEMMHRIAEALDHKVQIHLSPKCANGRWMGMITSASNAPRGQLSFPQNSQLINPPLKKAA